MKVHFFVFFITFIVICNGVFVPPRPGYKKHSSVHNNIPHECTLGPVYWCQNLTSAATCKATKHCIQTVWQYKKVEPDNSNVCKICLDMVRQARDQLESNETQEEIKEVFEGSCKLLIIKPIVQECDKIADDFIPDLIDTLASQMNPQIVCSVSGLCNNKKFENLIESNTNNNIKKDLSNYNNRMSKCDGCHTVVKIIENKFNKMTRDDILQGFLQACGKLSSFSDACSNIIITYFTDIYNHLKDGLNPNDICLMAGECSAQFHQHANVEITPVSHIGYVPIIENNDDLPCELCEQLVGHLRDLLVTNTTEEEFEQILKGLCQQTKQFKSECMSLVDEYYGKIYDFLLNELNTNIVCNMIGICQNNSTKEYPVVIPLLPIDTIKKFKTQEESKIAIIPDEAQLPIDLLVPPHTQTIYNKNTCIFCEFLLHEIQKYITNPKSEQKIQEIMDKGCNKLPQNLNTPCLEFVNSYEPAFVAILAQEIDPSQLCPLIRVCPNYKVKDVEIFIHQNDNDDGKCPMCLLAVTDLEDSIKKDKTKANIKNALDKLCNHLSQNLKDECNDFVNTYTNELIDMLIADFSPKEVCVYLKYCPENFKKDTPKFLIDTNDIIDDTVNGVNQQITSSKIHNKKTECILCEFVMKQVQSELKDNNTEKEIKKVVHNICNIMPKTITKDCNKFVDQYADLMVKLLVEATVPDQVCFMMGLCKSKIREVQVEVFDCHICEAIVYSIEKILSNPRVDHLIDHVLEKACRALPPKDVKQCHDLIEHYGKTIYNLVIHLSDKRLVCKEIGFCSTRMDRPTRSTLLGADECTWGPSYWCDNEVNARKCGTLEHCQKNVWKGVSPNKK